MPFSGIIGAALLSVLSLEGNPQRMHNLAMATLRSERPVTSEEAEWWAHLPSRLYYLEHASREGNFNEGNAAVYWKANTSWWPVSPPMEELVFSEINYCRNKWINRFPTVKIDWDQLRSETCFCNLQRSWRCSVLIHNSRRE